MKKLTIILVIFSLFLVPYSGFALYDENNAKLYLQNNSSNPWVTMALSVLNDNNIPTEHLKNISSESAIDYAAPMLAITSLQEDPRTFGSEDYVAKFKSFHNQNQIGDVNSLNDDIFGVLALISSGISADDDVVADSKNFILQNQNEDGGWGFSTTASSDTNMTAAGIMTLISAGTSSSNQSITDAVNYLSNAQNEDGGFPYDPNSSFGTASDTASTAWVVWALNAMSVDTSSWNQSGNTAISYLEKNQTQNGYFEYMKDSGEDAFSPNTSSYAVIALSGNTLPLNIISPPSPSLPLYSFRIEGSSGTICSGETEGPTAIDIVKNASTDCDFTYNIDDTAYGPYLNQIGEDRAEGLLGWMYAVNNQLPSVGAADYDLIEDDFVLWHFGEFGWEPTKNNTSQIDMTVTITDGEVQGTSTSPSTIGFTLDSTSLDFGQLSPGESKSQNFGITNTGNTDINIETIVVGDDVFKENLKLEGSLWSQFKQALGVNQNTTVNANLTIPQNYTGSGQKQGAVTIWAQ